jgi:Tfp pilus assembly protein PilF
VLSQDGSNHDDVRIENLLKQAVHLDPTLAKAHLLLADTMSERMDYESAVPEYETAIRLDQELRDAHYRLALAYKHIGKADLSVREMQIFRLSKQPKPMGEEGIDISQFISVMDARDQHSRQEVRCPAVSH